MRLDHLGGRDLHEHERSILPDERVVESLEPFPAHFIVDAADDPIGLLEVCDRIAFLQEFGIVGDRERMIRQGGDLVPDLVGGAHGYRRLDDHQWMVRVALGIIHRLGDVPGDGHDRREVGSSVSTGGGAHADEDQVGARIGLLAIRCEVQSSGLRVEMHQLFEPRFVDGA